MSKYCKTCKKPIPEGHTSCPTCEESVLFEASDRTGTGDAPASGASSVSWSELLDAQAREGASGEGLNVDSPSDQDLRRFASASEEKASGAKGQKPPTGKGPDSSERLPDFVDSTSSEFELPNTESLFGDLPNLADAEGEEGQAPTADARGDAASTDTPAGETPEFDSRAFLDVQDAEKSAKPDEEELVASVVEEEELMAEVVDEDSAEELVAGVVEEPSGEELVAELVDEPPSDHGKSRSAPKKEEDSSAVNLGARGHKARPGKPSESARGGSQEAELTESTAEVEALMNELAGPDSQPSSAGQGRSSKPGKPAKKNGDKRGKGADSESGSGVSGESVLDDAFSMPFPTDESTSSVDLGSSSVIEIPSAVLEAVDREKMAEEARRKAAGAGPDSADVVGQLGDATPPELQSMLEEDEAAATEDTRLGLVSMPEKPENEVLDLGEVARRATKLGKRAFPTQLVRDEEEAIEATLADDEEKGARDSSEDKTDLAAVGDEDAGEMTTQFESEPAADELLGTLADEDQGEAPLTASLEPEEGEPEEEAAAVATLDEDEERPSRRGPPAKPAKPVKPRYLRRWLGGMVLGLFLGVLGYFVLWAFDVQPLDKIAALQKVREATGAGAGSGSKASAPATPVVVRPKEDPHALLAGGDFTKAVEVFSKEAQTEAPRELTAKGEAVWLAYLQKQQSNKPALQAKEVQEAVKLFTDARSHKATGEADTQAQAQALFWLASIHEQCGDMDEARKMYAEGASSYPKQKLMFQAQLNRLGDAGAQVGMNRFDDADMLRATLALLLVAFDGEAKPEGDAPEAAPDFFEALVLVRKGEFDKALEKIESARKIHSEQRFSRLKKAQNPRTDPLEESFLKACDELKAYVTVQKSLKENGYLDAAGKLDFEKLATALKNARLASEITDAARKKLKDAKIDDADLPKAIDGLIADRDTLQKVTDKAKDATKIDDVNKALQALIVDHDTLEATAKEIKDAKIDEPQVPKAVELLIADRGTLQKIARKIKDAKIDEPDVTKSVDSLLDSRKQLETVAADLNKAGIKEKDPVKAVTDAIAQRDGANDRLGAIAKKLISIKMLPENSKPEEIDKGLKTIEDALAKADPGATLRNMLMASQDEVKKEKDSLVKLEESRQAQLKDAEARRVKETTALEQQRKKEVKGLEDVLAQRHTPQEMVDYWAAFLLDRGTGEPVNQSALLDVGRVRGDKQSKSADKGRALLVEGLAERNLGKYDDARKKLGEAKDFDGAPEAVVKSAEKSLAELTDPKVYYFPETERAIQLGKFDRASASLAEAGKVFPDEKGKLAIQRGTLLFEKARFEAGDRKLTDEDKALEEVRAAAKEAEEAGSKAEALYLLGRLDEEEGKLVPAREKFEQAVKLLDAKSPDLKLYQTALARVLWKIHRATPSPVGPRLGWLPNQREAVALLLVGLLAEDETEKLPPGQTREGKQADDIAKELEKKVPDSDFILKSQLLGIQGRWDEALQVYLKGLQGQMRRDQLDGLLIVIENHPGLRLPPPAMVPNPKLADQYWSAGLSSFWSRRYAEAEKAFYNAVKFESQDARYRYFLGLSQWLQNLPAKRDDAINNFNEGSKLEKLGRPASDAVNTSLERIQGPLREMLNQYRP